MVTNFLELASNPKFIPLVYDYCDMWCERCPITSRCLLFAAQRLRPPAGTDGYDEDARVMYAIDLARAVIEASGPAEKPIAQLDLALCDVATAPREPALGHPLEYLARHYGIQAAEFLRPLPIGRRRPATARITARSRRLGSLPDRRKDLSRAGQPPWRGRAGARAPQRRARLAKIAPDRDQMFAGRMAQGRPSTDGDGRIGGIIELLEAPHGVELRFPRCARVPAARPGRRPARGAPCG